MQSNSTYWRRQTNTPIFPDLLWSRPEQRSAAGKLLIVGGNAHAFAAPAEAYVETEKARVGSARVLLPDAVKQLAGGILETVEYAPSTPSGSFSQQALGEVVDQAAWADAVLLAGDLGRNSETAILLESFASKYSGLLAITKDAIDYIVTTPETVLQRDYTLLVPSFAQLQRLAAKTPFTHPFTFEADLLHFIQTLHEFSLTTPVHIIVQHQGHTHVAVSGQIISTKLNTDLPIWRVKTAAHATVWWLQNPTKPLEALATSMIEL